MKYRIVLHLEVVSEATREVSWWADSPDIEGWTAGASTLTELSALAEESVKFFLDTEDVDLLYVMESRLGQTEGPKELQTVNHDLNLIPQSRGIDSETLVTA